MQKRVNSTQFSLGCVSKQSTKQAAKLMSTHKKKSNKKIFARADK